MRFPPHVTNPPRETAFVHAVSAEMSGSITRPLIMASRLVLTWCSCLFANFAATTLPMAADGIQALEDLDPGVEHLEDLCPGVEALEDEALADLEPSVEALEELERRVEALEDLEPSVEHLEPSVEALGDLEPRVDALAAVSEHDIPWRRFHLLVPTVPA